MRPRPTTLKLTRALKVSFAIAAGVAVAGGWWLAASRNAFAQTYATTAGGYERVTLPDGSVIALNANSRVDVRYSSAERRVSLIGGEAQFNVTKNKQRPFIVGVGGISVRAVGTAFNVRMEPGEVEVLVTEGRVQVERTSSHGQRGPSREMPLPILAAGQRTIISTINYSF